MPLKSQVKYDELLTNISVQFQPAQGGYLADKVAPAVPVKKEDATYWVYDKSRFDMPDALRGMRSGYKRVEWSATRDSYSCEEYGLEQPIDDRERDNAASPLDPEIDATEIVTDMVLNNREKRVADMVLSTSNVPANTTLSGTAQWSDYSGTSDPVGVIKTGRITVFEATGYKVNTLLLSYRVFEALKQHPAVIERYAMTQPAIITAEHLARLFEVEEVIVGGVMQRTSNEGATDAFADVWGKDALLFYREMRPSLKKASFAYQFRNRNLRAFRYREDKIASDVVRVNEISCQKLVAATLAYLIKAAAA